VTLITKTVDYGHGNAAPLFAQVLVDRLGIPFSRILLYFMGFDLPLSGCLSKLRNP
jgi:hypothetical protein